MSENKQRIELDLAGFEKVTEDFKDLHNYNRKEAEGKLKRFLERTGLLQTIEKLLEPYLPPEDDRSWIQYDLRETEDDYHMQLLYCVEFLNDILKDNQPSFTIQHVYRSANSDIVHVKYIQPIFDFIEEVYPELVVPEPATDLADLTAFSDVDVEMKTKDVLMVNPRYFRNQGSVVQDDLVFVITEFTSFYENTLSSVLEAACAADDLKHLNLKVTTAENDSGDDIIMEVWEFIRKANIIIVNLEKQILDGVDGNEDKQYANFNVAYELGIAHAFGKQVYLLANKEFYPDYNDLPFDFGKKRAFIYDKSNVDAITESVAKFMKLAFEAHPKWPLSTLSEYWSYKQKLTP